MVKFRKQTNSTSFIKFVFFFFFPFLSQAQDKSLDYPRSVISELSSAKYAGRGYVEDGMANSADFMALEFEKLGLEKIGKSYFQEFEMPINVIKNVELKLNGKDLKYGIDFIAQPNSKTLSYQPNKRYKFSPTDYAQSIKFESSFIDFIQRDMLAQENCDVIFPPHQFEIDSLNAYYKNWASFYKPKENRNRAILFFTKDKLISSLSQEQDSISEFLVNAKYYSENLQIDSYKIDAEFEPNFKAKNVIGKITGSDQDSIIVLTAHYDHLGKMGDVYFPGASDNASGTAFLLNLAKKLKESKPNYTFVFIAFAAEEAGLVGSRYFVEHPMIDLSRIKFLINFDIMGAGEDGIQIVNSSIYTKEFELIKKINAEKNLISAIKKRGEACNSDHCPFYEKGIPSIFVYTLGGPGFYHDVFDTSESLNLSEFTDLTQLFASFIHQL